MLILRLTALQAKELDSILACAMDDAHGRMEMFVEDGNILEAQQALREYNHAHQIRYNLSLVVKDKLS